MPALKKGDTWEVACDGCELATITVMQFGECDGPNIVHISEQDWGMTTKKEPLLRKYYCHVCRHHNGPVAHCALAKKWDETIAEMRIEGKGPTSFVPSSETLKMIAEDKKSGG